MRNTLLHSLVMTVLFLWLGCAVNAQDRGIVTGTVVDSLGSPLPGVTVQLVGPETRKAITDGRGTFTFDLLRTGTYQLRFEHPGLLPVTQSATVQAGITTTLTVRMSIDGTAKVPQSQSRDLREEAARRRGTLAGTQVQMPTTAAVATAAPMPMPAPFERYVGPMNTEAYDHLDENPFRR